MPLALCFLVLALAGCDNSTSPVRETEALPIVPPLPVAVAAMAHNLATLAMETITAMTTGMGTMAIITAATTGTTMVPLPNLFATLP